MDTSSKSEIPVIKFSYNWNNKLTNKAFTTMRIHNPAKYQVERMYKIELGNDPKGIAQIKKIVTLRIEDLNDLYCYLDTGYNKTETVNILKKMYSKININNTLFDVCLLVYTKPEKMPTQTSLPL